MKSTLLRFSLLLAIQLWSSYVEASRLCMTSFDTVSIWSETGISVTELLDSISITKPIEPVFDDCPAPIPYTLENYSVNSVYLQWGYSADANTIFTIEIKPSTAASWSIITVSNSTSYNAKNLTPSTSYIWRVRSDCSPFSTTATASTGRCDIYNQRHQPMSSSAILEWRSALNTTYNLRWREQGGEWTEVSSLTGTTRSSSSIPRFYLTNSYSLTGLISNAVYEWQVEAVCGQGYTSANSPLSFTASCNPPTSVSITSIRQSGAVVNWSSSYSNGFTIQYRPQAMNDSPWFTTTNVFYNIYTSVPNWTSGLSNLTSNAVYEARIQAKCPDGTVSEFTNPSNFTTLSCTTVASNLRSSAIGPVSANLVWDSASDNTYLAEYRISGSLSWSQISASSFGTTLQNLLPNTIYDWRILTYCAALSITTSSEVQTFTTTICSTDKITYFSVYNADFNAAQLNWSDSYPSSGNYVVRYRPVNAEDYITLPRQASLSVSLTGLTANTIYEWQVAPACVALETSYTFTSPQTFTTTCLNTAYGLSTANNQIRSIDLQWSNNYIPSGYERTFLLRYRATGNNWTTMPVSTTTYSAISSLSGLTPNSIYEWGVARQCSSGIISNFTPISSFTTVCTNLTYNLSTVYSSQTSTTLYFQNAGTGSRYIIRYRIIDSADWTVISNITSIPYNLTGLVFQNNYEWQVASQCGDDYVSNFSYARSFSQTPYCDTSMMTVSNGDWNNPSVWTCNRVPLATDAVQILHTIMVPNNSTGHAKKINYGPNGLVRFGTGGRLLVAQ